MQARTTLPLCTQAIPSNAAPGFNGGCDIGDSTRLLMSVLDELDYGLMVLNESARMLFANHVALRECAQGLTVRLQAGSVQMQQDRDQRDFLKALWVGRRGVRTLLRLNAAPVAIVVAVVPLNDATAPATLLIFGKRQLCEPLSIEFFARTHGLSQAESTVLRGLCGGLPPEQIAQQSEVAISTVRTQISSIRSKTCTHSIMELMARLTVLPPLIPALHERGILAAHKAEPSRHAFAGELRKGNAD